MKNIGVDKVLHLVVSFLITAVLAMLVKHFEPNVPNLNCAAFAAIVAFCIGVGKEVYDLFVRKTTFNGKDLLADAVGCLLAMGCALFM